MIENPGLDPVAMVKSLRGRWRFPVIGSLVAAAFTAGVSLLLPRTFEAAVTIMPVESNDALASPAGSPSFASYLTLIGKTQSETELMVEILQSRTVRRRTIESLGLIEEFGLEGDQPGIGMEKALLKVRDMIDVSMTRAGLITVRVQAATGPFGPFDREADARARDLSETIAGVLVEHLDEVVHERSTSRARSSRLFIEHEIQNTRESLAAASDSLREFQIRNAAVSIDEQTRKMVQNLAALQAQIAVKEVSLSVLRKTMTSDNPQVLRLESEIEALRDQYVRFMLHDPRQNGDQDEVYIPLLALPTVAQEYADRLRNVKVQEAVYKLLSELYYQASIEEARDIPTVQVLDAPLAGFRKVAPRRKLAVVVSGMLTFLALSIWVILQEGIDRYRLES